MDRNTKKTFINIFVTLFFDLIAFALILPLLPKILDFYSKQDSSNTHKYYNDSIKHLQHLLNVPEAHNQVLLAGILGSWFSLLQFLSSPIVGALSDKFGRKTMLLITMSGTVCSHLIWYCATHSFALFILSRTISGLCKSNIGLSLAMISDVSNEATRSKGMAVVGSSFSLAFILGPMIGAFLSSSKEDAGDNLLHASQQLISYPALVATILSTLSLAIVFFYLEETNEFRTSNKKWLLNGNLPYQKHADTLTRKVFHYINPRSLLQFSLVGKYEGQMYDKTVMRETGSICFMYLSLYSGLEFTLSFLTHIKFGFTPMDQGKLYLFSGLIMALIQGGYIRRSSGSGKESKMLIFGLIIIIPSFIIMGLAASVPQVYLALALYAMSSAIVIPCLTTILSLNCPEHSRGVAMGTFRSIGSLARAFGPCLASFVFFTLGPEICYVAGAFTLVYPAIRSFRLNWMLRKQSKNINIHNHLAMTNGNKHVTITKTNIAKAS